MRLNAYFNEMVTLRSFAAVVKAESDISEMEVSLQGEMANPQGMKLFAVERRSLPEDCVCFPALCGVQSSVLVFSPNLPNVWGPPQSLALRETPCLRFALS